MLIKPVIPVVEYVVFYDYIKNELCVNKANKAMGCNGKCHLMKNLAKASVTPEKSTSHNFSVENTVVFCEDIFMQMPFVFTNTYVVKKLFSKQINYTFSFSSLLFRPPVI